MYQVEYSEKFKKSLRKFLRKNPRYKTKVEKKLKTLIKDPKKKSLRLHKLSGKDVWSISVDRSIRIILLIRKNIIITINIGTHDEVY